MESQADNIEDPKEHVIDKNDENFTEQQPISPGDVAGEGHEEIEGKELEGEHLDAEEGLLGEGKELLEGEELQDEGLQGEGLQGEGLQGEGLQGEELQGEELQGEELRGEELQEEKRKEEEPKVEEIVEEEQEPYVEEPPPDPAAPFNFSDSKEALRAPFELRLDQVAEAEQLWDLFQNYTPAYSDISGYITEKELVYMLKSLILMTYTAEQFQELISYCVRPPHPQGHITFEQFLKMVTIRQRDFSIEDQLRSALQVLDPEKTGTVDREFLKELLAKQGLRIPQKLIDKLIKEVDISNDGTIGIEDVVGTMGIDLNREDILMLLASLQPPEESEPEDSY